MTPDADGFQWVPGVPGAWLLGYPIIFLGGLSLNFVLLLDSAIVPQGSGGLSTPYAEWVAGAILAVMATTLGAQIVGRRSLPFNRRIGIRRSGVTLDYGLRSYDVPWENIRFPSPKLLLWIDPVHPSRWSDDGYHPFALTAAQADRLRWRFDLGHS